MDYLNLLWILLISLGINYLFFAIAFWLKTDAFTDITYSLTFSLLTIVFLAWKQNFSIYQILIFVLINLWALRLGSYLLVRILKIKVDHRFDKMRNSFIKFGLFWTLQGVTVFLVVAPGVFALTVDQNKYLASNNYIVLLLVALALFGLSYEAVADQQKFQFYNTRKSKQAFMHSGLWKISRHPNYFGEITFWFAISGIYLFGFFMNNTVTATNGWEFLWLLSPVYIMLLLNFVSGVPLLEKKSFIAHRDNPDYISYVKITPCIVPLVGKRGHGLRLKKYIKKLNKV